MIPNFDGWRFSCGLVDEKQGEESKLFRLKIKVFKNLSKNKEK
jgi:hypothetical protein